MDGQEMTAGEIWILLIELHTPAVLASQKP